MTAPQAIVVAMAMIVQTAVVARSEEIENEIQKKKPVYPAENFHGKLVGKVFLRQIYTLFFDLLQKRHKKAETPCWSRRSRANAKPNYLYEYSDRIEIGNPGNLYGKVNMENFQNETDYRNPNIAEIMLSLGYVNRFGSGVNTVSTLMKENGNDPAEFLLGDYTTFKVVVQNADVKEDGTDGIY